MTINEIIKIIFRRKWLIFWLLLFGAVFAFDLSVIQTPQFKASSKILIIQKQTQGQDIYTISKSAQYICRVLKEAVYSDSFFDQILKTSDKISKEDFPLKDKTDIKILQDLGVMKIDIYSPTAEKAEEINKAVTNALVINHADYHGADNNVELKILDRPAVSQKPNKPILWLNTLIGALIGLVFGLMLAFYKPKPNQQKVEASSYNRSEYSVPRGGF